MLPLPPPLAHPRAPQVVSVDSSPGATSFTVSTCSLQFTSANWNVYQPVYIMPVLSSARDKREAVRAHICPLLRSHSIRITGAQVATLCKIGVDSRLPMSADLLCALVC